MKKVMTIILCGMIFLFSLGLTLYPVISSRYNERHQSLIRTAYSEVVEQADDETLAEAKQQAMAYNAAIMPGAGDAYSLTALTAAAENYDNLLNLAGNGIMGYVEIPSVDIYLPIYHGTGSDSLERGVGHLLGSSLPVGGEGTHTILTGHSGMASQRMFTDITQMKEEDVFFLHVLDEILAYQVCGLNTVEPHDTSCLEIEPEEDLCTLVTCTPVGVNTHRLLVRGTRIPYEEAQEIQEAVAQQEQPASTWEQQYMTGLLLGLAAVVVIAILVLVIRKVRHG